MVWLCPCVARPGCYAAVLGDRDLCVSREPALCASRKLLAEGAPPGAAIEFRHVGSRDVVAIRGTIGELAKWTIEESDRHGLKRRRYRSPEEKGLRARPGGGVAPEIARAGDERIAA